MAAALLIKGWCLGGNDEMGLTRHESARGRKTGRTVAACKTRWRPGERAGAHPDPMLSSRRVRGGDRGWTPWSRVASLREPEFASVSCGICVPNGPCIDWNENQKANFSFHPLPSASGPLFRTKSPYSSSTTGGPIAIRPPVFTSPFHSLS